MIGIKSLHKFFNKGKQNEIHVINDVSLELPERGMVAVFGKSGCGKTTLLNVIGGLDGFSSGELTVEGSSIRKNTDDIRNRYMGYIFQNYNLNKEENCFDNVADALRLCGMSDKAEIEKRVVAALKNVGMEKYRLRTPDTLSGGQQQRIAIARAIVKNPKIILADEPTGNLDEANTVVIMELLRQIAKEHLVLLVTHEANLVDYYCDTVIELSDGKVADVRRNDAIGGYSARDKNDIFLGELDKCEITGANAEIEYYGDAPQSPLKLKIVNSGGKMYIQINTPKVQVLDSASEVKLREGVFKHGEQKSRGSENIDMSALPPVESARCGKLFSLGSSIKSGYKANFKKGKRGRKFFRICMGLFAAIFVLVSAFFGTAINDLIKADKAYSHNTFYMYTDSGETSEKLLKSVGSADTGIDYIKLGDSFMPYNEFTLRFYTQFFETFDSYGSSDSFTTNAVIMGESMCRSLPLVLGKKEGLNSDEIVLTTAAADNVLEKSTVGFIAEYKDLLGLATASLSLKGKNPRIVGIVKSDEAVVFASEFALAAKTFSDIETYVLRASEWGIELESGEALQCNITKSYENNSFRVGDEIKIHGKTFNLTQIQRLDEKYDAWLEFNGHKRMIEYDFFESFVSEDLTYDQAYELYVFDYYDYYFEYLDEFMQGEYKFENDYMSWLYIEKGVLEAKLTKAQSAGPLYFGSDADMYYYAIKEKARTGKYPTHSEAYAKWISPSGGVDGALREEYVRKTEEFGKEFDALNKTKPFGYLVNDADYIELSKRIGETHETAGSHGFYSPDSADKGYYYKNGYYTVVHSSNPEKTKAYLNREFSNISTPDDFRPALVTPEDIYENIIKDSRFDIIGNLISLVVTLVLMSLCMYFMMRSSFMIRVKEVGIYRAIGASKKNLVFKFFIEALVLTMLTVFIGYLLMSLFMACLGTSAIMATVLYYPFWLALCVLVLLLGVSLFFGIIPVLSLLRKSPSAILAKYDI
ncbi:ABC transporter ATP-binding protein/permease [Pumilibacter muris]|uniref:ABC transporter ATP-binding protein/permease n=1 Tax=Pumilibacter muris TaxID=2941510 RepID=UPI002041BF2B|nr:ABC transporter ATP-binding protein/permease [Pumilibacter muris]